VLALSVAIWVTVLDQWTKLLVRADFAWGNRVRWWEGFFNLTYVRNPGAAWGILGGQTIWLTALSVVMLVVMVLFRRSFLSDTWEHRLALGLMLGGIMGNLMDRIKLGWVTDFFDFYVGSWHWPAFNIADAAICTGVGIYILSAFWVAQHPLNDGRAASPESKPPAS
jgi:signal peptidase II